MLPDVPPGLELSQAVDWLLASVAPPAPAAPAVTPPAPLGESDMDWRDLFVVTLAPAVCCRAWSSPRPWTGCWPAWHLLHQPHLPSHHLQRSLPLQVSLAWTGTTCGLLITLAPAVCCQMCHQALSSPRPWTGCWPAWHLLHQPPQRQALLHSSAPAAQPAAQGASGRAPSSPAAHQHSAAAGTAFGAVCILIVC